MFPLRSTFVFFEPPPERPIPVDLKVGWYRLAKQFRYLHSPKCQIAFKVPWLLTVFSTDEHVEPEAGVLDDSAACSVVSNGSVVKFEHQQLHRIHRHTGIPLF